MLAVLIDADNAQPAAAETLMKEISLLGNASVRRIYGDWTTPNLAGWKNIILNYSIQPVQQFRYTVGKNATDSAMIIDAMDLLYTKRFDGFCLVSSDSDFTRLAARIREEGLAVYGFGEQKTPVPFIAACDKFIYTEFLDPEKTAPMQTPEPTVHQEKLSDAQLMKILKQAVCASADEHGWALLGPVGSNLAKRLPGFNATVYGHAKLSNLFDAVPCFELEKRVLTGKNGESFYVREKITKKTIEKKAVNPNIIAEFSQFAKQYKEGDSIMRRIENISWMGLLVALTDGDLKGLLHKSNLPKDFSDRFSVGQKILVKIKTIKVEACRIELVEAN